MRIYLPATFATLRTAIDLGEYRPVGPAGEVGPVTGFAATPALCEWYGVAAESGKDAKGIAAEIEEVEYAAFTVAAQASLRLLDADPSTSRRRVVVSADVSDDSLTFRPDLDPSVIRSAGPVPVSQWACVHVDSAEAEADIKRAAAAMTAADLDDQDAQFIVDAALGHELEWYAVSELEQLLG